jgi:hypothetical protein
MSKCRCCCSVILAGAALLVCRRRHLFLLLFSRLLDHLHPVQPHGVICCCCKSSLRPLDRFLCRPVLIMHTRQEKSFGRSFLAPLVPHTDGYEPFNRVAHRALPYGLNESPFVTADHRQQCWSAHFTIRAISSHPNVQVDAAQKRPDSHAWPTSCHLSSPFSFLTPAPIIL